MITLRRQVEDLDDAADTAQNFVDSTIDAGPRLGIAVAVLVVGVVLARVVIWVLRRRWDGRRTHSFTMVMSKLAGWLVGIVFVAVALTVAFPSVDPVDLIAGLGVVSIAAGFAFQDVFSNLLSGLLLIFRQPFVRGDQVDMQEIEGTVRSITIRETELETFDGRLVLIPNKDVYQGIISIRTPPTIRSNVIVGCSYDDDLATAARVALDAVRSAEGVAEEPAPEAFFVEFGESSIDLDLRFWSDPHEGRRREVLHRVVIDVKAAFDREGLTIPWPIRTLDVMADHDGATESS